MARAIRVLPSFEGLRAFMRPTIKTILARLAAGASGTLLAVGCSGDPNPPSGPSPPPAPGFSISGVVAEAGNAIADAGVSSWVETERGGGPGNWLRTDAQGRYRLGAMPPGARVRLLVTKQGYVQQCAAAPVVVQDDAAVDLELVSRTNVTAASRQSAPGFRTVTGTVVEMAATGLQPMAGIYVGFVIDPSGDVSAAVTYTDSKGRFALCGLPANEPVQIAAGTGAGPTLRYKFVKVPPGQDSGVEIILP